MKPEIKEKIKKESSEKSLARLSKEIRRETKTKLKMEKQVKKQDGVEKKETEQYIDTINEKLLLLLVAITPDKIQGANLASISKAFRSILGQRDAFIGNQGKEPDKNVNLNFNVNDLSPEEIMELLNKKSSENQDE